MDSPHLLDITKIKPHNEAVGSKKIRVTKKNFPALEGIAFYHLVLAPGTIREPHWHANADELGYCLKGEIRVTIFISGNQKELFIVKEGEAFFVPSGSLHALENMGGVEAHICLQFSDEEPEDFSLSGSFGMFSDAVLGNTWGVSSSYFAPLKRSTKEIFAAVRKGSVGEEKEANYSSAYHFGLEMSPPLVDNVGGSAKVARKNVWPILQRQALYSLLLTGSGMREPHWHPETSEMGFVKQGKGRMSIMNPQGKVDTFELNENTLYFIPKGYPHHIENLLKTPLHIMIFFDNAMPGDIGFTGGVTAFSSDILASTLNTSPSFFSKLPKFYEDLFIVEKVN